MGGSKSSAKTSDTALSKQQAEILKTREAQYQKFFFPELIQAFQEAGAQDRGAGLAAGAVRSANTAFGTASSDFSREIARRGLAGSGFEATGLAALGAARAASASDAVIQGQEAARKERMGLLQLAQGMSPQPTTAAPLNQTQTSKSGLLGFLAG